jgi:hypothetical protein
MFITNGILGVEDCFFSFCIVFKSGRVLKVVRLAQSGYVFGILSSN